MQELQIVRGGDPILTADEFHKSKIGKENLSWGEIMCLFARYHCENQARAINIGEVVPIDIDKLYPLDEKIIPI